MPENILEYMSQNVCQQARKNMSHGIYLKFFHVGT